jgi:hypothetical protein
MALLSNGAEGGTDGVSVSTSNSGGTSGNGWSAITKTSGSSDIQFDTAQFAHGALSYLVAPATTEICEMRMSFTQDPQAMASFYVRIPSNFSAASTICQIRPSTGIGASLQINNSSGPRFRVQDGAGTTIGNTTAISTGTWYRCELRVVKGTDASTGVINFAYYLDDDSAPVETAITTTTANTGTIDYTNMRFGRTSAATADTTAIWMDSFQIATGPQAAALGLIWPAASPPVDGGGVKVWCWDGAAWI